MEEKKKIEQFTEANSPVRLIEPDQAWAAMQQKLDVEWPAPKRFRWMRIWGSLGVVVVAIVATVLIWKNSEVRSQNSEENSQSGVESQSGVGSLESGAGRQSGVDSQKSIVDSQKSLVESQKSDAGSQSIVDSQESLVEGHKPDLAKEQRTNNNKGTGKITDSHTTAGAGSRANDNGTNTGQGRDAGKTNGSGTITNTAKMSGAGRTTSSDKTINADKTVNAGKTTSADKITGSGKPTGADLAAGRDKSAGTGNVPGRGTGKGNGAGKPAGAPDNVLNNNDRRTPLNQRPAQQQVDDDLQASTHFALHPATQAINVAGHVAPLPKDSSVAKATAPDELKNKNKRSWQFMAGLQWAAVLPAKDNDYYSTGSNGSNQVYRHLLPAVVLTVQKNRHRAGINLYPFLQAQFPDTAFSTRYDTSTRVTQNYSLVKMFGYGAGINYACNIYGNWWLGAGVQGNWWKKGLVHYQYHQLTTGTRDTLLVTGKNDTLWKNFAGVQYKADLELWYDRRHWALGLQGSMPLAKPLKVPGSTTRQPISVALLLRWKIFALKRE